MVRRSEANPWLHSVIRTTIKSDIDKAIRRLNRIDRNAVPSATAKAMNRVAVKIQFKEYDEMRRVFDRPTRFTLNSLKVKYAKANKLTAKVELRDWAPKGTPANTYLGPQIYSFNRQRNLKGFEKLLNARGVLPDGYYAVPAKRARLDTYGNISKGLLNQILSYSGAQRDRAQNTKQGRRRQTRAKFIILDEKPGQAGGLWAITPDQRIYPVLIFVRQTNYKPRFDFFKVADRVYRQRMPMEFEKALKFALNRTE